MNRLIQLLILGLFLNITGFGQEINKFPIKAGCITYLYNEGDKTDTIIFYFDNYGAWQCEFTISTISTGVANSKKVFINDKVYNIYTASKSYVVLDFDENSFKSTSRFLFNEDDAKSIGIERREEKEFLGKKCVWYSDEIEDANFEYLCFGNLILKHKFVVVTTEAISINEAIPDKKIFEIPSDYRDITPQKNRRFPIKAVSIEYISKPGDGKQTNQYLYFDNYGQKICAGGSSFMEDEFFDSRQIINGNDIYELNMVEKKYRFLENTPEDEFRELNLFMDDLKLIVSGYTQKGTAKFHDRFCKVYEKKEEQRVYEIWVWNNIIIKAISKGPELNYYFEAVSIKELCANQNWFEIPNGFVQD